MSRLMAPTSERSELIDPLEVNSAEETDQPVPENGEGDRHTALRLLSQISEGAQAKTLPVLATASDVREVVQFLKKKPTGITIVEAMDTVKKRVFEPRKVTAYEFWGIVSRDGDRLKLSPLGWEFARTQEPEARIYRSVLDGTEPYRSVLEWIHQQNLDLVTHTDVAAYWQTRYPETLDQNNEKTTEGNVVCFFHICQAAELGTVTIGKRGQPARLRVDREELQAYIEGVSLRHEAMPAERAENGEQASAVANPGSLRQRPATSAKEKLRLFISCCKNTKMVDQIKVTLELADIESHVAERGETHGFPVPADMLQTMRECDAGLIVVTREDCREDEAGECVLSEEILIEISAAFVLYNRRVVLLWDKRLPLPANLSALYYCEFDGSDLTWDAGVKLLKAIKEFKSDARKLA
jgi:hypothetical protein